jgi:hypothetical protein
MFLTVFSLCREYMPQNIMHDRRVVRGSTHAAMVIPAGTYPDNLFGTATGKSNKSPGKSKRATNSNNMGPSEEFFQRDIRTPEPVSGRQNIDIQTD